MTEEREICISEQRLQTFDRSSSNQIKWFKVIKWTKSRFEIGKCLFKISCFFSVRKWYKVIFTLTAEIWISSSIRAFLGNYWMFYDSFPFGCAFDEIGHTNFRVVLSLNPNFNQSLTQRKPKKKFLTSPTIWFTLLFF